MPSKDLIDITYDDVGDVAYVKLSGSRIRRSREIDGAVVANHDVDGRVVGLQILGASELDPAAWREHYRTCEVPGALFAAVEAWLERRPRADTVKSKT